MLDGKLKFFWLNARPDAGYAIEVESARLFRNGEHVGYALAVEYDRDALGWWVEYEAFADSPLGQITDLSGVPDA